MGGIFGELRGALFGCHGSSGSPISYVHSPLSSLLVVLEVGAFPSVFGGFEVEAQKNCGMTSCSTVS